MRGWVRVGLVPGAALLLALSCATGEEIDDEGSKGGFSGIGSATGTGGLSASGGFGGGGSGSGGISAKGGFGGGASGGAPSGGSGGTSTGGTSSGGTGGASASGGTSSGGSGGSFGGSGGSVGGSSGKGGTGGSGGSSSGGTGGSSGGGTACGVTANTCAGAEQLGSHCGDLDCGSTVFSCSTASWLTFQTRTGKGSRWFRAKANECAGCCTDVEARISLEVPAGMNYDLYIYSACGAQVASSTLAAGQKESTAIYVQDDCFGGDSGFDYVVEVRWVSGTACTADWKLTLQKTNC